MTYLRDAFRTFPAEWLGPNWENKMAKVVLKPVCKPCQERLNVVFEDPAVELVKALMADLVIDLTPTQQVILAGWLVKTSIVIVMARQVRKAKPAGPEQAELRVRLHAMLETGTPPLDTVTRLAYVSPLRVGASERPFLPPGWPGTKPFVVSSIFNLPFVICDTVVGVSEPALIALTDATDHDNRFLRLWPPHITNARWPPGEPLALEDIPALRDQWDHAQEDRNAAFPAIQLPPIPPRSRG